MESPINTLIFNETRLCVMKYFMESYNFHSKIFLFNELILFYFSTTNFKIIVLFLLLHIYKVHTSQSYYEFIIYTIESNHTSLNCIT